MTPRGLLYAIAALGAVLLLAALRWTLFLGASAGPAGGQVSITVPAGASAGRVAALAAEKGLVDSPRLFGLLLRLTGAATEIKAGEHRVRTPVTPRTLAEALRSYEDVEQAVTIPEGLDLAAVADLLAAKGIAPRAALAAAFADPAPVRDLDPEAADLEGYLFPDTYRFARAGDPAAVVKAMVATFRRRFAEPRAAEIARSGRSLREVVTLASLVEKETAVPFERPLVAAVYLARLEKKMRLQCDPTVLYAARRAGDAVPPGNGPTRRDLERDDAYNTYAHAGLPPGPIAAPGLASLDAALKPARSRALYFVARGDGSHTFSTTLEEHDRAVARYRRAKASLSR